VEVLASGDFTPHALSALGALPGVRVTRLGERRLLLRLLRHDGDTRLHGLLRTLLEHGAQIEACAAERSGLREVLSRLESA
jgi:hypothetical protein